MCQKIPALSDSNTTNWLLTLSPDVYLFGALAEACLFAPEKAALGNLVSAMVVAAIPMGFIAPVNADPSPLNGSYAIVGALSLYLDFVNLFISLLRFTGSRRD